MSLADESTKTFFLRLATVLIQVPVSVMLARFLGVEGKGLYTLCTVVPWMVAFVSTGGLDTAQTYMLSGRKAGLSSVAWQSTSAVLILSFVAVPVYLWLAPHVIGNLSQSLLWLSALVVPLALTRSFVGAVLMGCVRIVFFNLYYLLIALLSLVLVGLIVVYLDLGLYGALVSFLGAQALAVPFGLIWIRGKRKEPAFSAGGGEIMRGISLLKASALYGLKGHLAGVLVSLNQRFDVFLLGMLSSSREVGLYSVAVAVAEFVWHVPMSVHVNLFPRVAALGSDEGAVKMPQACRLTLALSGAMALLLLIFGALVVRVLYGRAFIPAMGPLLALLPGVVAFSVATVFESFFAGVNRRHYQSLSVAFAFALCLGLDLLLIPSMGALGAALASTAAYTLQMIISITLYRRLRTLAPREYFLPRLADARMVVATFRKIIRGGVL